MQNCITDFFDNLTINQPQKGYRFSIDPFLLCSEIPPLTNQTILDIGCGSGIIPLILNFRNPGMKIYGVEIQKELADFAIQNVKANNMEKNISILYKDIKKVRPSDLSEQIDIIVSNPPYKKENSGRLNPDQQKAIARHEIKLNIVDLVKSCKRLLSKNGKLYIIFPADRVSDLIDCIKKSNINPLTIKFVHTKNKFKAKFVIVSAINNGFNLPVIEPPLNIFDSPVIPL